MAIVQRIFIGIWLANRNIIVQSFAVIRRIFFGNSER